MFIEITDLSKQIKGVTILDHMNLHLEQGRVYGLRGKNGSGKTMLMRAICGLILPSEGTININGEILGKDISFPRSIGALIENPSFISNYTGFKNLKIIASIQNKINDEQIEKAIETVGLDPHDKRKYRKYSLGMKQRLGIACAIMEDPDIVVLDEPINALDEKGVTLIRDILHRLRESGTLVIVACHDKEELEYLADEIYTIEDGKIVNHTVVNKTKVSENGGKADETNAEKA